VYEDYRRFYGAGEKGLIASGMRLQINTQHTRSSGESCFADVVFLTRAEGMAGGKANDKIIQPGVASGWNECHVNQTVTEGAGVSRRSGFYTPIQRHGDQVLGCLRFISERRTRSARRLPTKANSRSS